MSVGLRVEATERLYLRFGIRRGLPERKPKPLLCNIFQRAVRRESDGRSGCPGREIHARGRPRLAALRLSPFAGSATDATYEWNMNEGNMNFQYRDTGSSGEHRFQQAAVATAAAHRDVAASGDNSGTSAGQQPLSRAAR